MVNTQRNPDLFELEYESIFVQANQVLSNSCATGLSIACGNTTGPALRPEAAIQVSAHMA